MNRTVKEAAAEHALEYVKRKYSDLDTLAAKTEFLAASGDFTAGVAFAQRWIPVEEELPEGTNFDNTCSDIVLIIDDFRRVHVAYYDYEIGKWICFEDNLSHLTFTHWRSIELK
jgi:hypothetical protein